MSNTMLQRGKTRVKPHNMRTIDNRKRYMQIVRADNQLIVGQFSQMAVEAIKESNRRLATPAHFRPLEEVATPHGQGVILRRWEQKDPWGMNKRSYMYRIELPSRIKTLDDGTRLRMFPEMLTISEEDLIKHQQARTIQIQRPIAPAPAPRIIALLPAPSIMGLLPSGLEVHNA
ncbi:hypothetical protein G4Y79_15385 [Phototrophicus methaneseepsis]|uniref:Uncharacterized protein n=1 Tax=Phototrophicus methaneseepsis TaxID=2710758 RepID=A0A7S8E642_9CHLR|nr:hypothetical protein [Phototrophicus methaneseepsis]QPC81086.1 hypothetical protein G4Y79_15385 [Phototrophicus methaneseepsis]